MVNFWSNLSFPFLSPPFQDDVPLLAPVQLLQPGEVDRVVLLAAVAVLVVRAGPVVALHVRHLGARPPGGGRQQGQGHVHGPAGQRGPDGCLLHAGKTHGLLFREWGAFLGTLTVLWNEAL